MPDLLYEIGTEELPAGYIEPARERLVIGLHMLFVEARLGDPTSNAAATPRRLVVSVTGILERQPPLRTQVVGPPARVAFTPDGQPTPAARGFARSKGVPVGALRIQETDKGPYAVVEAEEPGRGALELLPGLLTQVTASLAFPKTMRWEPEGLAFARPIRWLVALLDEEVLPLTIAGVEAGRTTYGHRFLAPGPIDLANASFDDYLAALRQHFVIADIAERREILGTKVAAFLERQGAELTDMELLEEVTNMVEWPHAVEGSFDERFLHVPAPVLIAAMKGHQRYFPVTDAHGRLVPRFVAVSDRTEKEDELVRRGNERVLLARLDDAQFFWEHDRRRSLDELVPRLAGVVFLGGLGDNLQRTERLVELSARIAEAMGPHVSAEHVRRAAYLCKADLLTGLVGEFPALQGTVGGELARAAGEAVPVAEAIAEHYLPAGADGALPATLEGCALALADKLDVMVGCFSLGLLPSGSQDPYALRRNALGVLLIIEGKGLGLHLRELVDMARDVAAAHGIQCDAEAAAKVLEFFRDRLYHAAIERGYRHDFVRAVLAAGRVPSGVEGFADVRDFWNRLAALAECAGRIWWPALVELVDRTYRIHRDAERVVPINRDLLQEPLEKDLAAALDEHYEPVAELLERGEYTEAAERYCSAFAQLVHDFFDQVFVNVEDEALRLNRKSLCALVYHLFADRFADLYVIERAEAAQ